MSYLEVYVEQYIVIESLLEYSRILVLRIICLLQVKFFNEMWDNEFKFRS